MNTWKNTKWKYSQDNKWVHNKAHHYMSCSQQTTQDLGFKYSIKAEQSRTVDVYQEDCLPSPHSVTPPMRATGAGCDG